MTPSDFSDTETSRNLLILYATETGNAQSAADSIARQCRRIAFQCRVMSTDAYSLPDLVSEDLIIFVVSTTGSGLEPRSMTSMWNMLLRANLPEDLFEDLPFAVFGLGDTAYEKFCWPAKKLSRRMSSLGAIEICERGEGDEQHPLGIDGALQPWVSKLLDILLQLSPLPPGVDIIPVNDVPQPRVMLKESLRSTLDREQDALESDIRYHLATVKKNERITAADWFQDVRHLEFSFEDDTNYSPGDIAVIYPIASRTDVESFLDEMELSDIADDAFRIEQIMSDQSLPDHLPEVTTLRTLFSRYVDFNAVPTRSFFQFLRYFTTDDLEKEKLDEFLSPEGADELYEYCHRVRRTIREVLVEFRHVKIPKDYIFDVFPPMRARHFSIASSVKIHPREIQLCVAMVKYRTKLKIPRKGVCTSYLSVLKPSDTLRMGIQRGFIRLPPDDSTPVICIGPGTGVAPMRSIIEERVFGGSGSNTLYFGCRSAIKDQHYGSEWKSYVDQQQITYRAAFSRDAPEGVKRTYVQDLITEDAEQIWRLIGEGGAWVYISGSSNKMPGAVKEALAHAIEIHGGHSSTDAKKYLEEMAKEGRLIEECWS
ncbi:hypothetical protein BDQ12DRAFT_652582 [Crucibulum laeve]|uniref:NADPH-dependent diflavin oxidoreductase 1 n=1 Tax=Crucibulum laeve TaxID=68775 RepID=A0A5C3LZM4_9AGAR|nr:hypothetical protein BDQ12DRAFT_652582 [Crucibulum laeve]